MTDLRGNGFKSTDVEKIARVSSADEGSGPPFPAVTTLSPRQYRVLIWKMDAHLLPPLFVLWFVSLVDRINIGSANIFGIQKDLHMNSKNNQFNTALIIAYVGLIICELPSNWLLKKTSPSKVFASECILLAICTIGEGVITNPQGLYAMRFCVGIFEAGLIPGSVYLLAHYYPRYELQWRLSMLMVGNGVSTAFGGLLALAIAGIHSSNGYHPWRWIFIIEGCMTAGVTIIVFPFLPNWPATAKWLTDEERAVLAEKIRGEGLIGRMDELNLKAIKRIFFDWKIYICAVLVCCTTVTAYSVAIFAPTIISQFEPAHSSRYVQSLVIPIFAGASVGCLAAVYASDKLKHRAGFAIFGYLLTTTGAAILVNEKHMNTHVKYAALFLMAVGTYISLPMLWTMLVNNVSGQYKIGAAVALQVGIGNIGGIVSAWVFKGTDAPLYSTGYKTILGMTVAAIALVSLYTFCLWMENGARHAGKRDHRLNDLDINNLGDDHPSFRYGY
ncbi:MFS general substrate transporter [Acephala macrosclerotiorum]|nr:MFS general substrate transporter [Acephala macrosclerotiorum]